VSGDPELLRIALRNLLDNAMRYSRPGDTVRVALAAAATKSR
jgi:signal transduction histidine kinase